MHRHTLIHAALSLSATLAQFPTETPKKNQNKNNSPNTVHISTNTNDKLPNKCFTEYLSIYFNLCFAFFPNAKSLRFRFNRRKKKQFSVQIQRIAHERLFSSSFINFDFCFAAAAATLFVNNKPFESTSRLDVQIFQSVTRFVRTSVPSEWCKRIKSSWIECECVRVDVLLNWLRRNRCCCCWCWACNERMSSYAEYTTFDLILWLT